MKNIFEFTRFYKRDKKFRDYFGFHFSINNYIQISITVLQIGFKISIKLRNPKDKYLFQYLFKRSK